MDATTLPGASVSSKRRGAGLWLTLSRPQQLNALNAEMLDHLDAGFEEAASDDCIAAVVITGEGRAFCAGADIGGNGADPDPEAERQRLMVFMQRIGDLTLFMERFPKPIICGINGVTLAGGIELALACDIVIAVESARIGDGHARYGLLPGGGSSVRLMRKLSPAKARYLLFTGEMLPATDPIVADLLTQVVPDGGLEDTIEALVATLAKRSPLVLRRLKELSRETVDQPIEAALRLERYANGLHYFSQDRREGLAAFRERRDPVFVGR